LRSLRWKLGGSLLLVVLVSVSLTAFLINHDTAAQFQQYVQGGNSAYTQRVVDSLTLYYRDNHGWQNVLDILQASLRNNGERLALADSNGRIIADTAVRSTGKSTGNLADSGSVPVEVSGQTVGTLYLSLNGAGQGRGYKGGRSISSQNSAGQPVTVQSPEDTFLSRINRYIWLAGLIALAIALLLGLLLTRQIIRPLHSLNHGARQLSRGDLTYRVKVKSRDEIGQLADSFNAMAQKLANSEQARRRLVSDVAHELRTPLTIIQGTVDGIQDGVFTSDQEHLDTIREQTVLLNHLVTDLRDLSLAESGQLKLDLSDVDLVELSRRKISQFARQALQKNIHLELVVPAPLPAIRLDSKRIEQVISNLISNALRFTPAGGHIEVTLTAENGDLQSGSGWLTIGIADSGEGIAAEHLPHIFNRFYRVETSRSRSEGGTGLGLAIVKQMVEAHGGQVSVVSQPGRGSTFSVRLPYQAQRDQIRNLQG
jgi:signal transduction histidine kinase